MEEETKELIEWDGHQVIMLGVKEKDGTIKRVDGTRCTVKGHRPASKERLDAFIKTGQWLFYTTN